MRQAKRVMMVVMAGVCVLGTQPTSAQMVAGQELGFRLVSSTPTDGFTAKTLDGVEVYLANRNTLSDSAVVSATLALSRSGSDVILTLTDQGIRRVRSAQRKTGADQLAVFVGNRPLGIGTLTLDVSENQLVVSGLSPKKAQRLTELISSRPSGATIALVPSQGRIRPGQPVNVDIYVSGAVDLRTFQVTFDISGGTSGSLEVDEMVIDTSRADYVFGTLQKIEAADTSGKRVGGVLFGGGVDATEMSYLGTARLRPTDDAAGIFRIGTKGGNRATILWTSTNNPIGFETEPAMITVGQRSKKNVTDR